MKTRVIGYSVLFFLITVCSVQVNAQHSSIKGKVVGTSEFEYPIVKLCRSTDSTLIKGAICDSTGFFELEFIKNGSYFIFVSFFDYEEFSSKIEINHDSTSIQLPDITLNVIPKDLKGVEIIGKTPFIERKIDRVVLNPDALIGNTGTALELLEKAPGVIVDFNGNISLKGKSGVMVFIDNKPTYMSETDLAGYLRSIPATNVSTIDIMTNPPAKYDASGNAGIININLKKLKTKGLNGGLTLSYGQGRYLRSNNSFSLNYRVNKINVFTTLGWSQNNSYQDLTINRYYYTTDNQFSSAFLQNSYIKKENGGRSIKTGLDWYVSKKSTIGVVLTGFYNPSNSTVTNMAQIQNANKETVSVVEAYSTAKSLWYNGGFNTNYTLKIDSLGKELSFNADYINYTSDQTQTLINSVYGINSGLQDSLNLYSTLPARIEIKTAKLDYTHPLKKNNTLDFGLKTAFVSTDNTASFYDVINNENVPNYTFSNRFLYNENNNAAYANYSQEWKKFSMQLGLRFESITMKGRQLGNPNVQDSSFTRIYNSLFPTAYFSYVPDTSQFHQFGLSFGRRIDYPNYQDMNPFTYPLDGYTYYAGNPFLRPTFSYNFELSHTYKNVFTTVIDYSIVHNLIQETNQQINNIYYSRPGNFGQQIAYGISTSGEFSITKWWNLMYYSELKNISYNTAIYNQPLVESKWYWYVGPTCKFIITPKLSAELAGSYQTRILVGQFLTIPNGSVRGGIAYKILKDKGTLKLNVSDIFYTNQPGGDIRNIQQSEANWLSYLDTQVYTLSFSYRFNKGNSLNARKSGASDEEKQRVRTN